MARGKSRRRVSLKAVIGLLVIGSVFVFGAHQVSAQWPGWPPSWPPVNPPSNPDPQPPSPTTQRINLANSYYRDNLVLFLPVHAYPKAPDSNWPLRSDPAYDSRPTQQCTRRSDTYKLLPHVPDYYRLIGDRSLRVDPYAGSSANPIPNTGNNFSWSGGCTDWVTDAGTGTVGSYTLPSSGSSYSLPAAGAWIYPTAYGGWALPGYNTSGWKQAVSTNAGKLSNELGKVYPRGCSICGESYYIWDRDSQNGTRLLQGNYLSDVTRNTDWQGDITLSYAKLHGQGTILTRNEFSISQEHYNLLTSGAGAELYLEVIGDDFYNVYINGVPIVGSPRTVDYLEYRLDNALDIAALLNPGDGDNNVIAIQGTDKTIAAPTSYNISWSSIGRGLWYNLRLDIPPNSTKPDLVPHITTPKAVVPIGENPIFNFFVSNNGTSSSSDATYQITFDPDSPRSGGSCSLTGDLNWVASGSSNVQLRDCITQTVNTDREVCAELTIFNPKGPGTSSVSTRVCVDVGKMPAVQVSGGDVAVRSNALGAGGIVRGVSFTVDGARYGSWAEYGVFGPASIDIYSGGALAHNTELSPAKNRLTFANVGIGTPGRFVTGTNMVMPDLTKLGISTGTTRAGGGEHVIRNSDPTNRVTRLTGNSSTTNIRGEGDISGTYVIEAEGNVRITGNIDYQKAVSGNLANLPQVIIKARNILIDQSVTNIDAWLITPEGIINTCAGASGANPSPYFRDLNTSTCNNRLQINGIVQAKDLVLRRTWGGETAQGGFGEAAEVFNNRSDGYLWLHGKASASGKVRTEGVRELPPRF